MIYFQLTNLISPIVLPWTFIMLNMGVNNINSKIGTSLYLVLHFTTLVIPIYQFFDLLKERSTILQQDAKLSQSKDKIDAIPRKSPKKKEQIKKKSPKI